MMKLGLCDMFNNNNAFYTWLKLIMAIPLLPTARIYDTWIELKNDPLPGVPVAKLRKFKQYIEY